MVKLNAYTDDERLHDSDRDPVALDVLIQHDMNIANEWFRNNGMIVNASKHRADHKFAFSDEDSNDLFGITLSMSLSLHQHISAICYKITDCAGAVFETSTCLADANGKKGRRQKTSLFAPILCLLLRAPCMSYTTYKEL